MAASPSQTMGSTNTVFIIDPWLDLSYLMTPSGIIKVAVIILNLLGFICVQSSPFWSHGSGVFFNIVAHLGLWFSSILLALYIYHLVEKYHNIKWLKIEFVGSVTLVFLNLITATIAVAFGPPAFSAAGFFSYIAMVLYGFEAFLKLRALKSGEPAQGRTVIAKQIHQVTPPAVP